MNQPWALRLYIIAGLLSYCTYGLAVNSIWDFIDSAILNTPEIQTKEIDGLRAKEIAESLANPEDPVVEFGLTNRTSTGSSIGSKSQVAAWGLRQKLPFWTTRSRQAAVQSAIGEATKWDTLAAKRQKAFELLQKLYTLGKLEAEQELIKDRRARFQFIKSALEKTRASSPTQKIERKLIQSAVEIVEGQFDQVELEVQSYRKALNQFSNLKIGTLKLKWLDNIQLQNISDSIPNMKLTIDPELKKANAMVSASELELSATSPRPEIELYLQTDKEAGGSLEHNLFGGVSATIPLNAIWGSNRRAAELNRTKMELERNRTIRDRDRSIELAILELQTAIKAVTRFPIKNMNNIVSDLKEAEVQVRQSWITATQFLEFDRQAHQQIQEIYNAQLQSIKALSILCVRHDCQLRDILGGSL